MIETIGRDIDQYLHFSSDFLEGDGGPLRRLSALLTPAVLCVATYRAAHWCYRRRLHRLANLLTRINCWMNHIFIHPDSVIGPGMYVPHPPGVYFRGSAGECLTLYARSVVGGEVSPGGGDLRVEGHVTLGNNVTVGAFAVILGDVAVGDGAVIGPSAVINNDMGPGSVMLSGERIVIDTCPHGEVS